MVSRDHWLHCTRLSVLCLVGLGLFSASPMKAQAGGGSSVCDDGSSSGGGCILFTGTITVTATPWRPPLLPPPPTTPPPPPTTPGTPAQVPGTSSPKGIVAFIKKKLVKRIWDSLTDSQQKQAVTLLEEWLDEQGLESCHSAAAEPETAREAANQLLASDDLQLTDKARTWANRLLNLSSDRGISNTILIICNHLGL